LECHEKQIHHLWNQCNQSKWRLDRNPQISTLKLLAREEYTSKVEVIKFAPEPGMVAIGFAMKRALEVVGDEVTEAALDGTCICLKLCFWLGADDSGIVNTNSSNLELSALIAEVNGQGIPLGFLFTGHDTAKEASTIRPTSGAKARLLKHFLSHIKLHLPKLQFTISDKEMSEIEAFRDVFPDAKIQLCFWHGIRTVEGRLAEDRPSAPYDPGFAHKCFDFIDPTWTPDGFKTVEDAQIEMESGGVRPRVANQQALDMKEESEVRSMMDFYSPY
jgi:hypothetical protein